MKAKACALVLIACAFLFATEAQAQELARYPQLPLIAFNLTGYGAVVDTVDGGCVSTRDTTQTERWDFAWVEVEVKRGDWVDWRLINSFGRWAGGIEARFDAARAIAPEDSTYIIRFPNDGSLAAGVYQVRLILVDEYGNRSCPALYPPFDYQPQPLDVPEVWFEER